MPLPFRDNAEKIVPGSIVNVANPLSSSGKVTGPHWFIIIQNPRRGDGSVLGIGCTSSFYSDSLNPKVHLAIPYAPHGHPATGFRKPTVACADWAYPIRLTEDGIDFDWEIAADNREFRYLPLAELRKLVQMFEAIRKGGSKR